MKLKLSDLKPNPFKKDINGGKLNEEQILKIQANMADLGLMGALPVFKKGNQYHLISGHHRAEALRRVKGKDFEVEVVVHNYSEENVLRGMVVENLTQRMGEFVEEKENLLLIRAWLKKNVAVHSANSQNKNPRPQNNPEAGSVRDIAAWLNRKGEVMSTGKICNILNIADRLAPELQEKVGKASTTSLKNQEEEVLPVKTAEVLATIEDQDEQVAIANIVMDTEKFPSNLERTKAISLFKELSPEEKEKVLEGKVDLSTARRSDDVLSGGEMALRFNKKANELVLEMRTLRKTLNQFRTERLFDQFTPQQRHQFHGRLETVRKEYTVLMKELDESMGVLQDE
jgi:hypothetical protein